ncbi:hypothetical protein FGRMN_4354 [Fusarium graminum]|nr:hypothetical protein FGRMN_4354 [Fusarium graminum]
MRGFVLLGLLSDLAVGLTVPVYPTKRGVVPGVAIYSCTQEGTIALTFDDGPFVYTDSVLDQLAAVGFKATFFVNGYNLGNIADFQSTVTRMVDEGHQIGSHTYGHPNLVGLQDFDIEQQMSLLGNELSYMIGKYPVYMRPPYFSFNEHTLQVLGQLGYKVIIADIDTNDWRYSSGGVEPSLASFNSGLSNGDSIVLMHDVHQNTVDNILPLIISQTLQSGKRAVTVGECLGDPEANWYRVDGFQAATANTTNGQDVSVIHTPVPEAISWMNYE